VAHGHEDPRTALPSVDRVLRDDAVRALLAAHPRGQVVDAVRDVLDAHRAAGTAPSDLAARVADRLRPSLARVVNATGVVLHTNLGRAPLAPAAVTAAVGAAGAASLEWDRATGERGSRHAHVAGHLRALTGAEDACVANTNAGAVLLALCSLGGGEVVVSRGQLVEIGGGFRVPDVLATSGVRLVEVGTTNRTRLPDYATAIGPGTVAILRVHPSNFRTVGFTEEVGVRELAALARERGVALVDDLGSGALVADPRIPEEPDARTSVAAGADLVCFSGDKLLGGPQAGIIAGTADAVARCRAHPLMRALRPDKMTLAALEATLALHRDPERAWREIPALAMIGASPDARRARAGRLAAAVGGEVVETVGRAGGGTLPLLELPSFAVALDASDPAALAARLRDGGPPVAVRVAHGRVLLDVLALDEHDLTGLPDLVARARA
jgi:L-seryl-tRNA(Ser) seleniumtransferase